MKRVILLSFLSVLFINSFSQRIGQYSQYIYTQGLLNPAYTGTRDAISGLVLYRNQWMGVDGAPTTIAFNIHSPIGKKGLGIGLSVVHDEIGPDKATMIYAAAAYKIKVARTSFFSFGMQAGVDMQLSNIFSENNTYGMAGGGNDPSIAQSNKSQIGPNVGVGFYLYNPKKYFVGLSVPSLAYNGIGVSDTTNKTTDKKTEFSTKQMVSFLYGGYIFNIGNSDTKLKPTLLWKNVYGAPLNLEAGLNVLIKRVLWLGAAYRTEDAVIFLVDYKINKIFSLGASYDYTMSKLSSQSDGTVELRLSFDIAGSKFTSAPSMRFF